MSETEIRTGADVRPPVSRPEPQVAERPGRGRGDKWPLTVLLLFVSLSILFPLYITVTTALKTPAEAAEGSLAFPADPQWGNFPAAIELTNFPRALFSSLLITVFARNATVGIIMTVWVWNDFMLPLVMLSNRDSFTLPLVQYVFQSQFTTDFSLAFATYPMPSRPC